MTEQTAGVQLVWQQKLDQGEFVLQRCDGCGRHVFFPRSLCPHCGGGDLDWVAPSGLGTVYAVTTVARAADAGGDYNVSLIDLDEGVRLMSRVEGLAARDVRIGLRVKARIQTDETQALVVFDPVTEGEGA